MAPLVLTNQDLILLHLWRFRNLHGSGSHPPAVTQGGISERTGIRRSHVPRNVKRLVQEGSLLEEKAYVVLASRHLKVYALSSTGIVKATELRARVLATTLATPDGSSETLRDIHARLGDEDAFLAYLVGLVRGTEQGAEPPATNSPGPERRRLGLPPPTELIGRTEDISTIRNWSRGTGTAVLACYGPRGIGLTALAATACSKVDRDVLYLDLARRTQAEVLAAIGKPFGVQDQVDLDSPVFSESLLVLDGYHRIDEDVVEWLAEQLPSLADDPGIRILVLAPKTTPVYDRFYSAPDLADGMVREYQVTGLSPEDSRLLLARPDIDVESLKQLHLLCKGNPAMLIRIRDGDSKWLELETRFTPEEVNLMLFLRDVKG